MKTLVIYKSKTGFVKNYANIIAKELDADCEELGNVSQEKLNDFDTVIYGGGFYKGTLNGLDKAKELFRKSDAQNFVIFASGANPNGRTQVLKRAWEKNLDENERKLYPHFYMQGGINYEKMTVINRITMKMFSKMVKKNAKTEIDKSFAKIIEKSCDISNKKFIEPLVTYVKGL